MRKKSFLAYILSLISWGVIIRGFAWLEIPMCFACFPAMSLILTWVLGLTIFMSTFDDEEGFGTYSFLLWYVLYLLLPYALIVMYWSEKKQ